MTINSVTQVHFLPQPLLDLQGKLDDLNTQLSTHRKANTYAGMPGEGVAIGLRAQLSSIDAFKATIAMVTANVTVATAALDQITRSATDIRSAARLSSSEIVSGGKTSAQLTGLGSLDQMLAALNSRVGDRSLFSGRAIDRPATASRDVILNGTPTQPD